MFYLNLHCLVPMPHVQLILLCSQVNQKRCLNKKIYFFHLSTALLAVLPDRHDAIACISSVIDLREWMPIEIINLIEICHPPGLTRGILMKDHTSKRLHFAPFWPHFTSNWRLPMAPLATSFVAPMLASKLNSATANC